VRVEEKEIGRLFSFCNLERGELFKFDGKWYIKVTPYHPINCVNLENGYGECMGDNTQVQLFPRAFVITGLPE